MAKKANIIEGNLLAKGKKFAVVVSRFNEFITERLLNGALDTLRRHGADLSDVDVTWVPGSFEVPFFCRKLAKTKKYDALIAVSAVIRGDTPHFDFVAGELAKGVARVSLETNVPISFGSITADSLEHAIDRAGAKSGNKGAEAAKTAIEAANLVDAIKS